MCPCRPGDPLPEAVANTTGRLRSVACTAESANGTDACRLPRVCMPASPPARQPASLVLRCAVSAVLRCAALSCARPHPLPVYQPASADCLRLPPARQPASQRANLPGGPLTSQLLLRCVCCAVLCCASLQRCAVLRYAVPYAARAVLGGAAGFAVCAPSHVVCPLHTTLWLPLWMAQDESSIYLSIYNCWTKR